MRNIRNRKALLMVLILIVTTYLPTLAFAQTEATPSVRYVTVESVTVQDYVDGRQEPPTIYPATHYTITFALFKVNAWADKAYFLAYVRDTEKLFEWQLGFSANTPPGLQSVSGSEDFLEHTVVMAEFPYANQEIADAGDGLQNYYFYRIHVWLNGSVSENHIEVGADYMQQPQVVHHSPGAIETSSTGGIDTFDLINEQTVGGVTHFDLQRETGTTEPPVFVVPEVPLGTACILATAIVAFSVVKIRKGNK